MAAVALVFVVVCAAISVGLAIASYIEQRKENR
jgi:uncharacterized protein HemY